MHNTTAIYIHVLVCVCEYVRIDVFVHTHCCMYAPTQV